MITNNLQHKVEQVSERPHKIQCEAIQLQDIYTCHFICQLTAKIGGE